VVPLMRRISPGGMYQPPNDGRGDTTASSQPVRRPRSRPSSDANLRWTARCRCTRWHSAGRPDLNVRVTDRCYLLGYGLDAADVRRRWSLMREGRRRGIVVGRRESDIRAALKRQSKMPRKMPPMMSPTK
jgi:hypothetical protein